MPFPASGHDPGPITDPDQASARWLTDALRRNGHLDRGEVRTVDRRVVRRTARSVLCRLAAGYSADAPPAAPTRLVLKLGAARAPERNEREVAFYRAFRALAPEAGDFPVVGCYDAVCAEAGGGSHLLLDDLWDTHEAAREAAQNVACLARLHAPMWGRLGADDRTARDDRAVLRFVGRAEDDPASLAALYAGLAPAEAVAACRRAVAFFPALVRHRRRGPATLVHGDARCANFLHPRDPAAGSVKLIDWEWWGAGPGTDDLAFMVHRCRRRVGRAGRAEGPRWETDLVRRYHDRLRAFGVGGYAWDDCWRDYRFSVIRRLVRAVFLYDKVAREAAGAGGPSDAARAARRRDVALAAAAFADLGCADLV